MPLAPPRTGDGGRGDGWVTVERKEEESRKYFSSEAIEVLLLVRDQGLRGVWAEWGISLSPKKTEGCVRTGEAVRNEELAEGRRRTQKKGKF